LTISCPPRSARNRCHDPLREALLSAAALATGLPLHAEPPHLRQQGSARQLVVEGKPFLIIGGELSNSAASSEAWMAPHWARLGAMHVNTVLAGYGAMIIQTGPEDYLIAGQGVTVTFEPVNRGSAGIDEAREGRFDNGAWIPGRLLNGDQTHRGRHIALYAGDWKIQKVRLYSYR
jgi:beta-galactosidase GanA